jgi:lipopolysaccharide export system permease protein
MLMGRSLRRYIAKRFLVMILATFVVCGILIFMIDLIELLRQARRAQFSTGQLAVITLLRLPAFSEILLPFATLVGGIGALLSLSRKSELAVMRAGGMSAWQFLRPGITIALLLGLLSSLVYNPLAAMARSEAERRVAAAFGKEANLLQSFGSGSWLRQDGADGPSVMSAKAIADQGLTLVGLIAFQYDPTGRFLERIDAERGRLVPGQWELERAWVARPGREPEFFETYSVSTSLDRERIKDALGSEISLSFWELPGLIEMADKASLPTARYRVQYELLLARPILLIVMVLLAATVSLRSFRQGGVQTMVVFGLVGGVGFFLLTEVSRQIGTAGLIAPSFAVWFPLGLASCVAFWVLVHQEDG